MFNPKKIAENISQFEKRFYEINPGGNFFESLVDFCHLLNPLWPSFVSAVVSDKNKVVACLIGDHMKLAIAEGQEIEDHWLFRQVMAQNMITEQAYHLYGYNFNQIISPLHDESENVIGTFSCFYRANWADSPSNISNFKSELVQAIYTGMPREIIFRFLAEKLFQLVDATHVLITERDASNDIFFLISEFKLNTSGKVFESSKREKMSRGLRIYGTILNTAQSVIQRSTVGALAADSPFVEDTVNAFIVSPIISKDDIIGTLNVGFPGNTHIERTTVTLIEEIAGYISICRVQDLLIKELENKTSETKTVSNRIEEKTIKISSIEVALETRDALLCSLGRIYEVIHTSPEEMLLEVFSPIIDSLDDIGDILIGFLREMEKDQHSLKNPANIKTLLDECILEAEEKILHRGLAEKKIGLVNRLSVSGVAEVNTAAIKSVFDRLIFSIIDHSGTEVDIFFESRCETGKIVVSLSNYDNGSFMFKTSSRESQRPVAIQLLFRLIQSLFRLNGIEFSVTFTSNTRYRLDTVFKMTEDTAVPFTDKPLPVISKPEKEQSRILIVDDDDSLRDLMVDILESRNFTVGCYAEAGSAIAEFKKNRYDLVITDLSLPGINGIELATQLKGIKPMMPVILVSGWGSEIEKIGKQNPEIDFVLPKPFNLVDFLNIVENSLKKTKT